jgi:uncharacterized damage-inducible protein DinB
VGKAYLKERRNWAVPRRRPATHAKGGRPVDETLLYGLNATHERIGKVLDDVSEEEARQQPAPGLAPIIWQAGHIALYDALFVQRVDKQAEAPAGFDQFFAIGTGGMPAQYPPLATVRAAVDAAQRGMVAIATAHSASTPVESPRYKTVGELLTFAVYHRGYHVGKITTLRALLKKARMFG